MLIYRFLLAIVISIGSLLIAVIVDMLFSPFPTVLQFILQIPVLVIVIDESRRLLLSNMGDSLTEGEINSCFFFAAPMAAFGSLSLFRELEKLHPLR